MARYLHILLAVVMAFACVGARGQTADLGAILEATRQAGSERAEKQSETLGGIAAAMRSESAAQQRELSRSMAAVAGAMRQQYDAESSRDFVGPGIEYSTYGKDARGDIAKSSTATPYANPYIMADYSAGIYAAPGGKRYMNLNSGAGQQRPVPGGITSDYGYRPSFGRMHRGVDLALHHGDTVRAAFEGKVVLVGNDPDGYGRYVKVKHYGGIETLYAHLSQPAVVHGQYVAAGQPVGLGGETGNATGPHLHFETRVNGVAVNPSNYFNFGKGGGAKKPETPLNDSPSHKVKTPAKRDAVPSKAKVKIKTQTVATAATGKLPRTASYKVRRGETLEKIARDHGMSVGEICRLNKMSKYTPMYTGKVIRLK